MILESLKENLEMHVPNHYYMCSLVFGFGCGLFSNYLVRALVAVELKNYIAILALPNTKKPIQQWS